MSILSPRRRLELLCLAFAASCAAPRAAAPTQEPPPPPTRPAAIAAPQVRAPVSSTPVPNTPAPSTAPAIPAQSSGEQTSNRIVFGSSGSYAYTVEFFPGAVHSASITKPEVVLGATVGARPAHHAEVVALWNKWAAESPRVHVERTGETFEGRELLACAVSSPKNIARLGEIRANLAKLADPRGVRTEEADAILSSTPPVAWMAYSIHGDELSGVDGGLALAYHLIAGESAEVTELLDQIVVVIDPMQNPDGRERILGMLETSAGFVPNLDDDSLHRGRWPYGRGNHYLFDMNRDWIAGLAPETRARWKAVRSWHPQLFVDAHEMGGQDTFLFYPQAPAINTHLPSKLIEWQGVFANDDAAAFDRYGWSYYTREWADAWAPFYSDAWGSLNGAIGILYEQARFAGQPLRKAAGEVATYREAVHHQAISSLSNLHTLARNKEAILRDFHANALRSVDSTRADNSRVFAFVPGRNSERESRFLAALTEQGIEVRRTSGALTVSNVDDPLRGASESRELPAGSYLIAASQAQSALVHTYLEWDARMDKEFLLKERRELEKKKSSKIYDTTAWNLALAFDLDACWCDANVADAPLIAGPAAAQAGILVPATGGEPYGWVVDGADDASAVFAARAMELGLVLQLGDREFSSAGRKFARGSLLVRRHENPQDPASRVDRAAREAGVEAVVVTTARSPDEGPDLGGQHFDLLARPRVALVSNEPIRASGFGHLWEHVDRHLGLPASLLDAQSLSSYDLRRYNVLVLADSGGLGAVLAPIAEELRTWVRSGGTLIAIENSAAAIANEKLGLSQVRRRQDVLGEVDSYLAAARREIAAAHPSVDEAALWGDGSEEVAAQPAPESETEKDSADEDKDKHGAARDKKLASDADKLREDEWLRTFSPRGVILRASVDTDAWITCGAGEELPVFFEGSLSLLARSPVQTPVRLAPSKKLRLSGLLWPEARERLAESAYLTVERVGRGQVILFASEPNFRGVFRGGARLLSNAIVYGPGAGASQPLGW